MPPQPNGDSKKDNPIDLGKILLPKKPQPGPQSPQPRSSDLLVRQNTADAGEARPLAGTTAAPTAPITEQKDPNAITPLQTFKGDIERVVQEGASVVSIAAAEAKRRGEKKDEPAPAETGGQNTGTKIAMGVGGLALLLVAAGVLAFLLLRPNTVPIASTPEAPFISVDEVVLISVVAGERDTLMTNLQAARESMRLSVGLIEWLYVAHTVIPDTPPQPLSTAEFLTTLAPRIPEGLLRTLAPFYLVGVHSFDENQPFLILQTDSYETGYRGMLDWELSMRDDLSPLFTRNPSPKSTVVIASSTASSSQTAFIQTGFVDKVVENLDTRVVLNDEGEILLLWAFLGRNTIVITTNEYTLREVVARRNSAPVVPIPR